MADYVAFYASSIKWYPNWCRRVHFFSLEPNELQTQIEILMQKGRIAGELAEQVAQRVNDGQITAWNEEKRRVKKEFHDACSQFSYDNYLGFAVIKPLDGSPVGKTILKHYDEDAKDGTLRKFNCTRPYKSHLCGLELTVCGLVFQEQDQAVSACATTALWTSLSKTKDFEDIRTPTPAQITKLATQFLLHFGRAMPQVEGLSVYQMCQAIESLGLSPYLIKFNDPLNAKALLYSAIISGFAPVLIIHKGKSDGHAVTVSGMKVSALHSPAIYEQTYNPTEVIRFDEVSGDLLKIYVNDDRYGPYFKVDLANLDQGLKIDFILYDDDRNEITNKRESWKLYAMLVPLHSKIRLSFGELRELSLSILRIVYLAREALSKDCGVPLDGDIQLRSGIMKHTAFVEDLLFGEHYVTSASAEAFNKCVVLSRYVGKISLIEPTSIGTIDVLVDTTNIGSNPHFLAIICRTKYPEISEPIVKELGISLQCPYIIDRQTR